MVTLSASPCASEHWLTIMMCTICENTPDSSPLYRCNMGHLICNPCFEKLVRKGGVIRCVKCNSRRFRQCVVSNDFLQKLKTKPGIGRRRRFRVVDLKKSCTNLSDSLLDEQQKDNITVEKLFQLTSEQITQLFNKTAREKCAKRKTERPTSTLKEGGDAVQDLVRNGEPPIAPKSELVSLSSKKPLVCPHYNCKKLITISSFNEHFQHDHTDIPSFIIERGRVLHFMHDVRVIEFNTTLCLAVFNVFEKWGGRTNMVVSGTGKTVSVGTFWLMVSGSVEERKSKSYVLYWVSTSTAQPFNCTIEMSSYDENFSNSTFCAVNKITDSYSVADVAYRLNCLNLCYASMRNLLQEGCKLHLRVTIH